MTAENNPRNLPDRIRRRLPHLPDITVEGIKETYDDMRSYTRRSIPLGLGGYSLYTALNNVLHDPKQAIAYGLAGTIIFTTDYKIAQREKWKQQEVYLGQARFWAKMEEEWKRNGETRFNQENHPPVTPIIEENSEEGYFMYDYLTDQAKVLQLLSETVRVIQSNPNMEESTKHYQDNINETCYSTRTSDRDNRFP